MWVLCEELHKELRDNSTCNEIYHRFSSYCFCKWNQGNAIIMMIAHESDISNFTYQSPFLSADGLWSVWTFRLEDIPWEDCHENDLDTLWRGQSVWLYSTYLKTTPPPPPKKKTKTIKQNKTKNNMKQIKTPNTSILNLWTFVLWCYGFQLSAFFFTLMPFVVRGNFHFTQ